MHIMTEHEDPSEHLAETLVSEALERYRALLPPDALEELRETLTDLMLTHPDGAAMLRQMRPEPMLAGSGAVTKESERAAAEAARRLRAGKK